jgi:hypothetical protein
MALQSPKIDTQLSSSRSAAGMACKLLWPTLRVDFGEVCSAISAKLASPQADVSQTGPGMYNNLSESELAAQLLELKATKACPPFRAPLRPSRARARARANLECALRRLWAARSDALWLGRRR